MADYINLTYGLMTNDYSKEPYEKHIFNQKSKMSVSTVMFRYISVSNRNRQVCWSVMVMLCCTLCNLGIPPESRRFKSSSRLQLYSNYVMLYKTMFLVSSNHI